MRLSGKAIAMVIAPQDFRDEELFVPRELFEREGACVTVVSTRTGRARGSLGGSATATCAIDWIDPAGFDAVLVIGGTGAQIHLWAHAALQTLVQRFADAHKVVGAICTGPVVLARAGVLRDRRATVWDHADAVEELVLAQAHLAQDEVVCADRVITGSGPAASTAWAHEVIEAVAA